MKCSLLICLLTLMVFPGCKVQSTRIWNVALGHEFGSHEYIDTDGFLKGFGLDLIDRVCQEGGMDCRIVRDEYMHCWYSSPGARPSGGKGLFGRWYDACTTWGPTVERVHVLKFTRSHFKLSYFFFYYLKGHQFNEEDMRGQKIGVFNGWAADEKCLLRNPKLQYEFSKSNTFFYDLPTDAIDALENNTIDAVFTGDWAWSTNQWTKLKRSNTPIQCLLGGGSMMSRKDSAFPAYWNMGLLKLKNRNTFAKFCEETNKKHGHMGDPFECETG